jgi:hypothetical protein
MMHQYPRVAWLGYFIRTPPYYDYERGSCAVGKVESFTYEFKFHSARFFPTVHFKTVEQARSVLDPLLDAWRISALLDGPAGFSFCFSDAGISQFHNDPEADPARRKTAPMPVTNVTILDNRFPAPPRHIALDDCVTDLAEHFAAYERSWGAILLHAYAMITRVAVFHGGEARAAEALKISSQCLKKVKRLASERGVGASARKFVKNKTQVPPTNEEREWLRYMMKELLRRSARLAANKSPGSQLNL